VSQQEYRWFKGNTHAHTTNSDGDSPLEVVTDWYRQHGYQFLAVTDHDFWTDVHHLNTSMNGEFLLIPGSEISTSAEGKPVHINALNLAKSLERPQGKNIQEVIQKCVTLIRSAGGVPQVNHPNWRWAFTHKELLRVSGYSLLEICNATFNSNNFAAGGAPGTEEIWDELLSRGKVVFGVAADDAHTFQGEFNPREENPGGGWVVVRAKELTSQAIMDSIERGDFYASTEITLDSYTVMRRKMVIEIRQAKDYKYTTTFIGKGGKVLKTAYGNRAVYQFRGNELYVRARIFSTNGGYAWIQPVFVNV
jgi:hypothetical protein